MNFKSIITTGALVDMKEAAKWYNLQKEGLGKLFIGQVRAQVGFIRKNPFSCSVRYSQIRTFVLTVYPYLIHYYVDEKNSAVVIMSVLHSSRNPEIWNENTSS